VVRDGGINELAFSTDAPCSILVIDYAVVEGEETNDLSSDGQECQLFMHAFGTDGIEPAIVEAEFRNYVERQ
jgi:hypothetical protein